MNHLEFIDVIIHDALEFLYRYPKQNKTQNKAASSKAKEAQKRERKIFVKTTEDTFIFKA